MCSPSWHLSEWSEGSSRELVEGDKGSGVEWVEVSGSAQERTGK